MTVNHRAVPSNNLDNHLYTICINVLLRDFFTYQKLEAKVFSVSHYPFEIGFLVFLLV